MRSNKQLKKKQSVAEDLKEKNSIKDLKATLKKSDLQDVAQVANVLEAAREIFPQIDEYLLPEEALHAAGMNRGVVDAIFETDVSGLSGCSNCHACCQNCHQCQSCDLCYTCQKEISGGDFVDMNTQEGLIRYQLMQLVQALSTQI